MIVWGIDPDTSATGICRATFSSLQTTYEFFVARATGRLARDRAPQMSRELVARLWAQHADAVAIEWQHARPGDRRPDNIVSLGAAAGMALTACAGMRTVAGLFPEILLPLPQEWKGSVPKEIKQRRILSQAGLTLASPELAGIPPSLRTHCVDALGLCLWYLGRDHG